MIEPRKPDWLKINLRNNDNFSVTGSTVRKQSLHTICQSGRCPNLGDCWNRKTATFMVGGEICTRSCKFCNTLTGKPLPLDPQEPSRVAESIRSLAIKHAVITSVDRDDLPDYGASHWATTIRAIKEVNPGITMEVLIPDFRGDKNSLNRVIEERPDIISHNLETVRRLTPSVRSVAQYETSLQVLRHISDAGIPAKSGLMLGLGERPEEVYETMDDLLRVGCRLLSVGQYLRPSKRNIPVTEYVSPVRFAEYKEYALGKGFVHVESGPFVRSSFRSVDYLTKL